MHRRTAPAPLAALLALVAALVTALGLLGVAGAPPARAAEDLPAGWYARPHTPVLTEVVGFGGSAYHLDQDAPAWQRAGYPTPRRAPTDYVRYPWSANIWAVTYWPDSWQWEQIGGEQWRRAGFPAPRTAGFIDGTRYWAWETSGEVFVEERGGAVHKLSYAEWLASGSQEPEFRTGQGYVKLSWYPAIARIINTTQGSGFPIGYPEWAEQDFPTPRVQQRVAGDRFIRYSSSSTVYYSGAMGFFALTAAQYRAAGSPPVEVL